VGRHLNTHLTGQVSLLLDLRFVDQHDRDVVANGVHALALDAFQAALIRLHLQFRFIRWTNQDVEQILADRHGFDSV
jgi:hypothetical protein